MKSDPILIVEENPITCEIIRNNLQSEGFTIETAHTGAACLEIVETITPCMILIDFRLPDMEAISLAKQLRTIPKLNNIALIACTGFISQTDLEHLSSTLFNEYMIKPIEPERLLKTVQKFTSPKNEIQTKTPKGKKILVADDNPTQLKLIRLHLELQGYRVITASDGLQALEQVKQNTPDLILSDVLMPHLDGFKFTSTIRQTSLFDKIPIILSSNAFVEESDQTLAKNLGANALILRTPDLEEIVQVIKRYLSPENESSSKDLPPSKPEKADEQERLLEQLERYSALNLQLAQKCSQQSMALTVLKTVSEGLLKKLEFEQSLPIILTKCFDVIGISHGALYLKKSGKLELMVQLGYGSNFAEKSEKILINSKISEEILNHNKCLSISPKEGNPSHYKEFLKLCNAEHVLLIPIKLEEQAIGILLMASRSIDLTHFDWDSLGQALGMQLGQAVALGNMISDLAISEKRYRSLMQNANDGTYVLNLDGTILEANDRALQIHSLHHDKLIGKPFVEAIDPAQIDQLQQELSKIKKVGNVQIKNIRIKKENGTFGEVNFSASLVDLGKEKVIFAVTHDVTEHNLLETQLRQAQKMEAIGQLTGGIAHDFNNILAIIGLYVESLSESTDLKKIKTASNRVFQAQQKAVSLTKQLLAFSRKQVIEPQVLNCNTILRDMKEMLSRLLGENIVLNLDLAVQINEIFVDRGNLEQIVMNLLVNARDAMPTGGRITIQTENVELTQEELPRGNSEVTPGSYVVMNVTDTGTGISPEVLKKIFEPFFTTKEVGKGTGLGLSTVYGIVHQAKGFIDVSSEVGVGTTFHIYLPKNHQVAEIGADNQLKGQSVVGNETILLVEDETMLREIVSAALREQGYQVLEAANGKEALECIKNNTAAINLIITDVVMPEMGGNVLVKTVRAFQKDIRVLYFSGYTEDVLIQNEIDSKTNFMGKPFSKDELLLRTRKVLDSIAQEF